MEFYNSTTGAGLVDDILYKTNSNTTSYPLKDITRHVNIGLDRVFSLILQADGRWQFDDNNYTDQPIATTDLVASQSQYVFNASMLEVTRVELSDSAGNWAVMTPLDQNDTGQSLEEFMNVASIPRYFDVLGETINLYPAPNYSLSAGLKVYYKRKMDRFLSTDTTKEPGFAGHLHPILSLYGQYHWFASKDKARGESVMRDIQVAEQEVSKFYSRRSKFEIPRLGRAYNKYK